MAWRRDSSGGCFTRTMAGRAVGKDDRRDVLAEGDRALRAWSGLVACDHRSRDRNKAKYTRDALYRHRPHYDA
jgi:hypothetical protein